MGKIHCMPDIIRYIINRNSLRLPVAMSVDVTHRCNLSCNHCYYFNQNRANSNKPHDIPMTSWQDILIGMKRDGVRHISWVGGEPLLRKNVIDGCRHIFPLKDWIITNGTIPIPAWNDVTFFISLDGTERFHDQIRGVGIYQRIKKNIDHSKSNRIHTTTTINTVNYSSLNELVREWSNTDIRGMSFDFHSALNEADTLWVNDKLKPSIVQSLKKLKREYGSFIMVSDMMLDMMMPNNSFSPTYDTCPVHMAITSLDSAGNPKRPCIMMLDNCNTCGCTIYYLSRAVREKDFEAIKIGWRLV